MIRTPSGRAVAVLAAALLGMGVAWVVAPRGHTAADELPRVVTLESLSPPGAVAGGQSRTRSASRTPAGERVRARPATLAAANRAASGPAAPTRLVIAAIGLSLPVRPVGVDAAGLMVLPDTAYAAGWYRFGRGPLDGRGTTVIAGHVDTTAEGAGPLARLAELRAGAPVEVRVGRRVRDFRVVGVERIATSVLDLPRLFARSGPARLRLVTCGGAYLPDQGGYQDNVVVTAVPAR